MVRKRVLAVLMLLSVIVMPGCWDKRELTDLAIISAIGIDRTNEGNYVLHFQIINPGNVAGGLQGAVLETGRLYRSIPLKATI